MKKQTLFIGVLGILCVVFLGIFALNNNPVNEETKNNTNIIEIDNSNTQKSPETNIGLDIGKYAPDFTLENLDGQKISLSDLRGQNVIINFWATWCPYCIKEMPDLNKLYIENKDDLVVLAIDVQESKSDIQHFLLEKDLTFPILLDKDGTVALKYMVRGIPTSYLLDKEGKIRSIKMSMMTYPEMNQMLDTVKGH